jgi:hypothetical protein
LDSLTEVIVAVGDSVDASRFVDRGAESCVLFSLWRDNSANQKPPIFPILIDHDVSHEMDGGLASVKFQL